jgi:hypothetical protein
LPEAACDDCIFVAILHVEYIYIYICMYVYIYMYIYIYVLQSQTIINMY